jgi:hypothetical protein
MAIAEWETAPEAAPQRNRRSSACERRIVRIRSSFVTGPPRFPKALRALRKHATKSRCAPHAHPAYPADPFGPTAMASTTNRRLLPLFTAALLTALAMPTAAAAQLPQGVTREQMWYAPTAEDWKKPVQLTFQRKKTEK